MSDPAPNPEQFVVPAPPDEPAAAATPASTEFRGRPRRQDQRRWPVALGFAGSAAASFGGLCIAAGASPAMWALVVVGVVAAVVALVVAHRTSPVR